MTLNCSLSKTSYGPLWPNLLLPASHQYLKAEAVAPSRCLLLLLLCSKALPILGDGQIQCPLPWKHQRKEENRLQTNLCVFFLEPHSSLVSIQVWKCVVLWLKQGMWVTNPELVNTIFSPCITLSRWQDLAVALLTSSTLGPSSIKAVKKEEGSKFTCECRFRLRYFSEVWVGFGLAWQHFEIGTERKVYQIDINFGYAQCYSSLFPLSLQLF